MDNSSINVSDLDISDFVTPCDESSSYNNNRHKNDKERRYRQQVEYGAKKYIKP
jgi:hypothetical protein